MTKTTNMMMKSQMSQATQLLFFLGSCWAGLWLAGLGVFGWLEPGPVVTACREGMIGLPAAGMGEPVGGGG